MNDWGRLCWNWRHAMRFTQAEAAEAVGCALRTWRRWEGFETAPDVYRQGDVMDRMILEWRTVNPAPDLPHYDQLQVRRDQLEHVFR
jgi:hypothetical protein